MVKKAVKLLNLFRRGNLLNMKLQNRKYTISVQPNPILSSPSLNYQIRKVKETDIPKIMDMRREMGSLDCESCMHTWLKLDPEGMNIAVNDSGDILGGVVSVTYPDDFVFSGMFFVLSDYRKLGIGAQLADVTLEYIGSRNAGLYSVPNKIKYYEHLNYNVLGKNFTCMKNVSIQNINTNLLSNNLPENVRIVPYQETLLDAICSYDFDIMGSKRNPLWELSCKEKNSKTFVAMKDGMCLGFGTIKLTCLGYGRVGPLYAEDATIAEALLKTLVESFPQGNGFAMMTLNNNIFSSNIISKLGVPIIQHLSPMYLKKPVTIDTNKVFAIYDPNGALY